MNETNRTTARGEPRARPSISAERAELLTDFYQRRAGKHSVPVLRALAFRHLCEHKTIYLGDGELIVGERGPEPKAVPTYPELTCHSLEDLRILDSRPKTSYRVARDVHRRLRATRSSPTGAAARMRDRIFEPLPDEWHDAYEAASSPSSWSSGRPGHTVLDDKIYRKGMLDFKARSPRPSPRWTSPTTPKRLAKREQLDGDGHRLRRRDPLRRAPRRAGRANWRADENDRVAGGELRAHRRGLPARAGPRPARLPRGAAGLLVLPPRRDHRAQRLGRVQPRPPRPAPAALLRAGTRRRQP